MKLSFDWVIGIVEVDISDCSVEDVNRLVEEIESLNPLGIGEGFELITIVGALGAFES